MEGEDMGEQAVEVLQERRIVAMSLKGVGTFRFNLSVFPPFFLSFFLSFRWSQVAD